MMLTSPVVVASLSTLAVLGVGGALTKIGPWYLGLRKPSWQPPGWVFAPVWTTIGVLTIWAAVLAWTPAARAGDRWLLIGLFAVNAAFNIGWSALFFTFRRPDWALVEVVGLWLSVLALTIGLGRYSALAGLLLLPYLVWVAIASVLNLAVVRLNRPFGVGA